VLHELRSRILVLLELRHRIVRSVARIRDGLWLSRKIEYVTGTEFLFCVVGWVKKRKNILFIIQNLLTRLSQMSLVNSQLQVDQLLRHLYNY